MKPRTLMILVGTLCLCIATGIALQGPDQPVAAPPPGPDIAPATTDGSAGDDADHARGETQPAATAPVTAAEGPRVDTSGWTSGIIRGDIQLAVSVLERLGSMTIVVEEARQAFDDGNQFVRPHRLVVPVERGRGTPTFEVRNVPFSDYPYTVLVHAPGLNGSQRTVVIDAEHPLVDDVVLSITPGTPFSVLVRDQDSAPHAGIELRMVPVGTPHGRTRHGGTTDNFGSIVFEDVLAGEYELSASLGGQPLGDAQRVTVQPGTRMFQSKVQGQGHVLTIPRGVALSLLVHDPAGYGIPDAKVTATATDRLRLTERETTTDAVGRAGFPHLPPGVWHVTIERDKFQRIDLQITLKPDQQPEQRTIKMVRTRW